MIRKLKRLTRDNLNHPILENSLDLQSKGITIIDDDAFNDVPCLHELNLSDNYIQYVNKNTFYCLKKLKGLKLNKNRIQEINKIDFNSFESLKYLFLNDNNIENIDIESFTSLTELVKLDLSNNKISEITDLKPLENLKKLKKLNLSGNRIMHIDSKAFKFLIRLVELDLSNNKISNINSKIFKTLDKLEKLNLAKNEVKELEPKVFKYLTSLTELDLSNNQIKYIGKFSDMKALYVLRLSYNQIKKLNDHSFDCLEFLKELHLNRNKLTYISENIGKLKNLKILNLANNQIEEIKPTAFNNLDELTELNLNENRLGKIKFRVFNNLKSLEVLYLESNGAKTISSEKFTGLAKLSSLYLNNNRMEVINYDFFNNDLTRVYEQDETKFNRSKTINSVILFESLKKLYLNDNKISTISKNSFDSIKNLEILSLNNNQLSKINSEAFNNLNNLKNLFLKRNKFENFDEFENINLNSLEELDLESNSIKNVKSLFNLEKLKILNLNFNQLNKIDSNAFNGLVSLEEIYLDGNKIKKISEKAFKSLYKLKKLFLNNNQIDNIKLGFGNNLRAIHLKKNKIKRVKDFDLESENLLMELDLSSNEIETIDKNEFENFENLNYLNLTNNRIKWIHSEAFDLRALKSLTLGDNKLSSFENSTFKNLKNLEKLCLDHNQIKSFNLQVLNHLERLETLDISYNQIEKIENIEIIEKIDKGENEKLNNPEKPAEDQKPKAFTNLKNLNLESNQIKEIDGSVFDEMNNLINLDISNNKIEKIEKNIFKKLESLSKIDFSSNKITYMKMETLNHKNQNLNVDMRDNIQLNIIQNVYKSLFAIKDTDEEESDSKYSNDENPKDTVNSSHGKENNASKAKKTKSSLDHKKFTLEKNSSEEILFDFLLSLYLNKSVSKIKDIFEIKYEDSFAYKKDKLKKCEFTILDFLISLENLDSNFIISLGNFVYNNLEQNKDTINKEFKLNSPVSFEYLCRRNDLRLFEVLFDNILNNDSNEYFKKRSLEDIIYESNFDEKENKKHIEDFFLKIDFISCFEIILQNKNEEMAIYFFKIIKEFFTEFNISNTDLEVKFQNFYQFNEKFLENYLPTIFRDLKWNDFISLILDLAFDFDSIQGKHVPTFLIIDKKVLDNDQINDWKNISGKFKEIFNSDKNKVKDSIQTENKESDEKTSKNRFISKKINYDTNILNLIDESKNSDFLSHISTRELLNLKWKYLPRLFYYLNLFLYIVFLVLFSFNVLEDKYKIVCLVFTSIFILFELIQLVYESIYSHILECLSNFKNLIEIVGYPLILTALVLPYSDLKSAFNSATILIAYLIMVLKLNKFFLLGPYINVFGKIINRSKYLALIIVIILIGFDISFKNRSNYYKWLNSNGLTNNTDNQLTEFDNTFEYNLFQLFSFLVGNYGNDGMGITSLDQSSLINFIIFGCFIFLMPILFINIFTGISIDEVQKLLRNAENDVISNKIGYVFKIEALDLHKFFIFKQLYKFLKLNDKIVNFFLRQVYKWKTFREFFYKRFYNEYKEKNEIDDVKNIIARLQERVLRDNKSLSSLIQNNSDFSLKKDFQKVIFSLDKFESKFSSLTVFSQGYPSQRDNSKEIKELTQTVNKIMDMLKSNENIRQISPSVEPNSFINSILEASKINTEALSQNLKKDFEQRFSNMDQKISNNVCESLKNTKLDVSTKEIESEIKSLEMILNSFNERFENIEKKMNKITEDKNNMSKPLQEMISRFSILQERVDMNLKLTSETIKESTRKVIEEKIQELTSLQLTFETKMSEWLDELEESMVGMIESLITNDGDDNLQEIDLVLNESNGKISRRQRSDLTNLRQGLISHDKAVRLTKNINRFIARLNKERPRTRYPVILERRRKKKEEKNNNEESNR